MKTILKPLVVFAAILASSSYADSVDLTPENLKTGDEVVVTVSGQLLNTGTWSRYPSEKYTSENGEKKYIPYQLKTGILSGGMIFYSKIERALQEEMEITVTGRLKYLPAKNGKEHGLLQLIEN